MTPCQLLRKVGAILEGVYGPRLRGVVLYGSEARGEADAEAYEAQDRSLYRHARREGIRV